MKTSRCLVLLLLLPLLSSCFQTQINGSTAGSLIEVAPLRDPGNVLHSTTTYTPDTWINLYGQERWDGWSPLLQLLLVGLFAVNKNAVDSQALYLVTASGGLDYDTDRNNQLDATGTPPVRKWHAIMSGEQLKRRDYRVSPVTEAAYRWIEPELHGLSDGEVLARLDLAARLLVTDIDEDGTVTHLDLGKWSTAADGADALNVDADLLYSLQDAILSGATDEEVTRLAFYMIEQRDRSDYGTSYWRSLDEEIADNVYATNGFITDEPYDTGLCTAGTTSIFARLRALKAINATRSLHDLPKLAYSLLHDGEAQAGALIQAANNTINHFPAPEDNCFSESGATASASSNLGQSTSPVDPAADVISWTNDAFNVATVEAAGHRRWVIDPFSSYTSYAQINGFSLQKVHSFDLETPVSPTVTVDYVAFPYSITPYRFLSNNPLFPTPWSVSMVEDKLSRFGNQHDYFSQATISVTRRSDGQSLAVTDTYTDTSAFGVPNFLSWNVTGWEHDTLYDVEIGNITMQSGQIHSIRYPVYIDYAMILDIEEPLEAGDGLSNGVISGSLLDNDDRDSYTLDLGGNTLITGDSQFANQAFFVLVYDSHKKLVFASDDAGTVNLEPGTYTVVASNCHDGGCYSGFKQYTITFQNQ